MLRRGGARPGQPWRDAARQALDIGAAPTDHGCRLPRGGGAGVSEAGMTTEKIAVAVDRRGVAWLTLARPERHNVLTPAMMDEIAAAATRLGRDPAVRVVVLAAEGDSFCAGGDLGAAQAQSAGDDALRAAEARRLMAMLEALDSCPRPVIGRIQGNAFGTGVALMAACDSAVAVEGARFGLTETRLGLHPAAIVPHVLARIGPARARRLFLSSRIFDAAEAVAAGLLTRAVTAGALDDALEAEIAPCLTAAPAAQAAAKALIRELTPAVGAAAIEAAIAALVRDWDDAEAAEGLAAFFEKRPAGWVV